MAATMVGVLRPELQNLIQESKVLLIGAGGIGCEVLKNLVLMGFSEIEVIDLDIIELSNLNRQFLFDKNSVGKPKSHVAKDGVLKFNPNVNIHSHYGDILDKKYGTAFFNKFKIIINALDNKKARSHVNRMCLSCDIPLIESGTMGYSGQVELIKKEVSLCYECLPKPEPKSYPMCTIRNTPKEFIHCIIWAKFLFGQLFGESEEEDVSMEKIISIDDENFVFSAREWAQQNNYDPIQLFKKVFIEDIDYLISLNLFKDRAAPILLNDDYLDEQKYFEYSHEPDNKVLNLNQYITMFKVSVSNIKKKLELKGSSLIWDKDDDDFMNFVVSSSNIRSSIFNIPFKNHFDIKTMAGNIVPAIATANAIIAGQIVIHALRVLEGKFEKCQSVFLREIPNHKGSILVKDKNLEKPNPKCMVCSTSKEIVLVTDVNKFTVKQFEELVLKKKLNMVAPDVLADGRLLISSDEGDNLNLYSNLFSDLNLSDGSRFICEDFFQNLKVTIMLHHKEKIEEDDPQFQIFGNVEEVKKVVENEPCVTDDNEDCIMETTNELEFEEANTSVNKEEVPIANEHENGHEATTAVTSYEEDISNDDILALKRKAEEDNTAVSKKSRIDE